MPERKLAFMRWVDSYNNREPEDEFDEDEEWNFIKNLITKKGSTNNNIYISNLGIIPLGNKLASYQNKIWIAHTNFKLTQEDKNKCLATEGIEGWKHLTPYRFMMLIGWMFKDEDVKKELKDKLCKIEVPKNKIEEKFHSIFPFYVQVKLKNGKHDIIGAENQKELEKRIHTRQDIDIIEYKSWLENGKDKK